ncbi:MAG TPA: hypothetical protein VKZ86_00025 [Cyclobacteriaceae bacterium]|nr:hypothetical protein [Cyclobacteriaceae bacterium]
MQLSKPLFLLALLLYFIPAVSRAQCEVDIDVSFHQVSADSYTVLLRSQQGSQSVTAMLHDLFTGETVQSKRANLSARETEVFTNVKPSLYTVYIKRDGCEEYRSLGSIEGIKIGQ